MDKMVAKLDRLYPKLKSQKRCFFCGKPATEIHHIIGRAHYILRYDLNNLLPICNDCHRLVHDKGEEILQYLPLTRADYLNTLKNVQLQDYLLLRGLTREEFFKEKEQQLLEEICNA